MADIADLNNVNFWVMHLIGAYEFDVGLDQDPNTELARAGIQGPTGHNTAYVFHETIRDVALNRAGAKPAPTLEIRVALHESGHLMGLPHPDPLISVMNSHTVFFGEHGDNIFSFTELGRIQAQFKPMGMF